MTADQPHATVPNEIDGTAPADEATLREHEGLPTGTVFLVSPLGATPPMRAPTETWGLVITAADLAEDDHAELFAGLWAYQQPPADTVDGDTVLRLQPPPALDDTTDTDTDTTAMTDVELLLAHHGRWRRVGLWPGLGIDWPHIIAPTVAAITHLHTGLTEATGMSVSFIAQDEGANE